MPPSPANSAWRRRNPIALPAIVGIVALLLVVPAQPLAGRADALRVDDAAFWEMVTQFSEPDGYFHSDNLVSNELAFQRVIPELRQTGADGAYLGVGPDQNFTYLVALQPRIAFIVDVRRQNALLHLLYKAILEMAPDRATFLSRLFSRPKPTLDRDSAAPALIAAFDRQPPDAKLYERNLDDVLQRLTRKHRFPLSPEDQSAIRHVYASFFESGPGIRYTVRGMEESMFFPTYAELVQTTDESGENHGYLASEDNYRTLRQMQERNLVVPVVGDFAGTKAIRSIGRFLSQRQLAVTAFYTSNVEFYLFRNGRWDDFAENLARLPVTDKSYLIRTTFLYLDNYGYSSAGARTSRTLIEAIPDLVQAANSAGIRSYQDVLARSR